MRSNAATQLRVAIAANAIETRPTVVRAMDGSRYYAAVNNVLTTRSTDPASTVTLSTSVAAAGASAQPVISYVVGADGATYEKTTLPNGSAFFKPVFLSIPS